MRSHLFVAEDSLDVMKLHTTFDEQNMLDVEGNLPADKGRSASQEIIRFGDCPKSRIFVRHYPKWNVF
jgi:hypothetical protein